MSQLFYLLPVLSSNIQYFKQKHAQMFGLRKVFFYTVSTRGLFVLKVCLCSFTCVLLQNKQTRKKPHSVKINGSVTH